MKERLQTKEYWEESGLSRVHFDELNRTGESSDLSIALKRFEELRKEYEGNPEALYTIDRFDPSSEWNKRWRAATRAALAGKDESILDEFKAWEKEKYPDVFNKII